MLVRASSNNKYLNMGLALLASGIRTDNIPFCPNLAIAFRLCNLEYQKKIINAGISNNAYKYSGFANLNMFLSF
jgi:hypothetical protein